MIKVDHIYSRALKAQNGPSQNLNRFIKSKLKFDKDGINYSQFTRDDLLKNSMENISSDNSPAINRALKPLANRISIYSAYLSFYSFKRQYLYYSSSIIDFYLQKQRSPDVIVFDDLFDCYFFLENSKAYTNFKRTKIVLFSHSNGEPLKMLFGYFPKIVGSKYEVRIQLMLNHVLSSIDRLVFISSNALENFKNNNPYFSIEKLSFFHNGIDSISNAAFLEKQIEIKKRDYSTYHLICVGTINERKAQELIVDTYLELSDKQKKGLRITFVGDGPLKQHLFVKVKNAGCSMNIDFKGQVSNAEVDCLIKEANIFVLVSYDEGLPISIIEAMRTGLPIIGSNVAGIPELVEDGYNGFVIEPTKQNLFKVLVNLHNYDLNEMGLNSLVRFKEHFTFDKMIASFINVIKKVENND